MDWHLFSRGIKRKVCFRPVAYKAGNHPSFCSKKELGLFLLSPGRGATPSQGYPQQKFRRNPFIHIGEERPVRVNCLAQQEHNAMTLARTRPGPLVHRASGDVAIYNIRHVPSWLSLYQLTWRSSDCIHRVVTCHDNCCYIGVYRWVRLEKENINKEYSIQNIL